MNNTDKKVKETPKEDQGTVEVLLLSDQDHNALQQVIDQVPTLYGRELDRVMTNIRKKGIFQVSGSSIKKKEVK